MESQEEAKDRAIQLQQTLAWVKAGASLENSSMYSYAYLKVLADADLIDIREVSSVRDRQLLITLTGAGAYELERLSRLFEET